MSEIDDDIDLDETALFDKPNDRPSATVLPVNLLRESLGPKLSKVTNAKGICLVVTTPNPGWIKPLLGAAKVMAGWNASYDGSATPRLREEQERIALDYLAKGGRVLCVATSGSDGVPPRLLGAADAVVDIERVTLKAVNAAILAATKIKPTGLKQEDIDGLDLVDAVVAIRAHTTAASCIKRIRAARSTSYVDPSVASAPEISELAGYGEAQQWAEQLIADLDRWRRDELPFSAIQRNLVLSGPPGSGKSTFMRSLAKSTGLPLISTSISKMFGASPGYLDSIIKQIDSVFAQARAAGPSAIVFLDEIEAIPNRAALEGRGSDWWTPVVNHVLMVLDSTMSSASSRLVVVGATNHPEKLDAALVRPGRLDRVIWIPQPDAEAIATIFRQHLQSDLPDVDLSGISELALGSTGAEIVGYIKAAKATARSLGAPFVLQHLVDAVCPPSILSPEGQRRSAIHEAGHAVAAILAGGHKIRSMSLGGQGTGGRVVFERPRDDIDTLQDRQAEILQLLSGRAAEEQLIGTVSTGAGGANDSDLARATRVAAASRLSYGLGGSLVYLADPADALDFIRISQSLRQSVEADLRELYQAAMTMVSEHRVTVLALADMLLECRTLSGDEVRGLVARTAKTKGRSRA